MDYIKIFSPATVANVSCGFDTLGFAIANLGDEITFVKTPTKRVDITEITGAELPYDINSNATGVVVQKMLKDAKADFGIQITMHKGFFPGSGLGSSAASSAGAAFGANKLLGNKFSDLELVKYAMLGEEVACNSKVADNVAAAIYGGFVLVRSYNPLDIVKLPTPKKLRLVAIHPQIQIRTEDARKVLPNQINLKDAITQWANVGGLIAGLYTKDYKLIGNSLEDIIIEPHRKKLIPHFNKVKNAALNAGALGAGISGSGPTIFALCEGDEIADNVSVAIEKSYRNVGIDFEIYSSKINRKGIKILHSY